MFAGAGTAIYAVLVSQKVRLLYFFPCLSPSTQTVLFSPSPSRFGFNCTQGLIYPTIYSSLRQLPWSLIYLFIGLSFNWQGRLHCTGDTIALSGSQPTSSSYQPRIKTTTWMNNGRPEPSCLLEGHNYIHQPPDPA